MKTLTILVTVDSAGVPYCTPVVDKEKLEVVWVMGTLGWEFEDLVGLPTRFFQDQENKGSQFKSKVKHPLGNVPTDSEYQIHVRQTGTTSTSRTGGKAIIRNDPG